MKKQTKFTLTLLSLMMIWTSGFAKGKEDKSITVSGYVHSYGNVPFNYPCLETQDGKLYALISEQFEKEVFFNTQGKKIEVTGQIKNERQKKAELFSAKNGMFNVDEWSYVEE